MDRVQVAQQPNRLIGWVGRGRDFLVAVREEMRKVTWPTRHELIKATRMIVVLSIILGFIDRPDGLAAPAHLRRGDRASRAVGHMEYRWYAIQTTAGHENKVRNLLQKRIEDDPRPAEQKLIRQALVPVQEVIEIKNGKKVNVERKLYPGYVLVEMGMSQEALHVVNSIQGVIKFVGTGKMPQPLRQDEVNRLLGIAEAVTEAEPKEEIPFMVGQVVEITEGPFSDFSGTVEEVLADKGKVRVTVSLFGRPTAVEMDYLQLRGHWTADGQWRTGGIPPVPSTPPAERRKVLGVR